eukprot:TRINITY_DN2033_c0_g2_i1.p1 TRINITY_DN2033_c0_g2~~TRINITY_DN2033_c0_g2_i1.p1  ORF type:complete len:596 (+),score=145.87 TRINITY_DN2033_c0_g2_i1:69-1856(+)
MNNNYNYQRPENYSVGYQQKNQPNYQNDQNYNNNYNSDYNNNNSGNYQPSVGGQNYQNQNYDNFNDQQYGSQGAHQGNYDSQQKDYSHQNRRGGYDRQRNDYDRQRQDYNRPNYQNRRTNNQYESNRGPNSYDNNSYSNYGHSQSRGGSMDDMIDDLSNRQYDGQHQHVKIQHDFAISADQNAIEQYLNEHKISIEDPLNQKFPPIITFEESNFPPILLQEFERQNFKAPFPIQAASWPICISGRDTVGIAKTGSGKTLSFIIPALLHILQQPPTQGPHVLVMAPVRELVLQIVDEFRKFARCLNIGVCAVYGGAKKFYQTKELRSNPQVVVATPGRLIDLLREGSIVLDNCSYIILDEADRMLDFHGFEPYVRVVMKMSPSNGQRTLWSATWPASVRDLAKQFLRDPVSIRVGQRIIQANPDVTQEIRITDNYSKNGDFLQLVADIFHRNPRDKVLIFCKTKNMCDRLANDVRHAIGEIAHTQRNFVGVLHGNKTQKDREYTINQYRRGYCRCIIATDVLQRGIDVEDITTVINYDFPLEIEDYVHRIGRTGRAEKKGIAISYFLPEQDYKLKNDLIEVMKGAGQNIPQALYQV